MPFNVGKYYLADAAYGLSTTCLPPYRGIRYHLKEWGRAGERPQNMRELFNLRHSSLRNVIERTYGVAEKRFPLLNYMSQYPYEMQIKLIYSCFALHNFDPEFFYCKMQ
jgi:hypothetical protein